MKKRVLNLFRVNVSDDSLFGEDSYYVASANSADVLREILKRSKGTEIDSLNLSVEDTVTVVIPTE